VKGSASEAVRRDTGGQARPPPSNQNGGDSGKDPAMDVDPPTEATDLTEGTISEKVVDAWSPSTEKLSLFFLQFLIKIFFTITI
jgi:hypothetical protein